MIKYKIPIEQATTKGYLEDKYDIRIKCNGNSAIDVYIDSISKQQG